MTSIRCKLPSPGTEDKAARRGEIRSQAWIEEGLRGCCGCRIKIRRCAKMWVWRAPSCLFEPNNASGTAKFAVTNLQELSRSKQPNVSFSRPRGSKNRIDIRGKGPSKAAKEKLGICGIAEDIENHCNVGSGQSNLRHLSTHDMPKEIEGGGRLGQETKGGSRRRT